MPGTPSRAFFLKIFCLFAIFAAPVAAQANESIYQVRNVKVDETADSEVAAKAKGLAVAKRRALQKLMGIMTLQKDRGRLPKLEAAQLEDLIFGISVSDEKMSRGQGRYLANVTVRFRPDRVRQMLGGSQVPYTETASKKLLILPILKEAGTNQLWEENNSWFQAWARQSFGQSLVPVTLPLGDISDVSVINVRQALLGDRDKLADIAGKYGADGVILTLARVSRNLQTNAALISVETTVMAPGWNNAGFQTDYQGSINQGIEKILARAAKNTVIELTESWKQGNLVDPTAAQQSLVVNVKMRNLRNWVDVQKRLDRQSNIERYQVESLSVRQAVLKLDFVGSTAQLKTALAQADLMLQYDSQSQFWVLSSR